MAKWKNQSPPLNFETSNAKSQKTVHFLFLWVEPKFIGISGKKQHFLFSLHPTIHCTLCQDCQEIALTRFYLIIFPLITHSSIFIQKFANLSIKFNQIVWRRFHSVQHSDEDDIVKQVFLSWVTAIVLFYVGPGVIGCLGSPRILLIIY